MTQRIELDNDSLYDPITGQTINDIENLTEEQLKKLLEGKIMKSLTIKSNNCLLNKKTYGGVSINDTSIGDLIVENLPEGLQDYKDYPVKLSLQIEFFGEDDLSVTTEGYEVVKKEENNESEVEE